MSKYLDRGGARDFLREQGVVIGDNSLKDHAVRGTGPEFRLINGRALYRPEDLLAWIEQIAQRPCGRGRRHKFARESNPSTAVCAEIQELRCRRYLIAENIRSLDDLAQLSEQRILMIPGLGKAALVEIRVALGRAGLSLAPETCRSGQKREQQAAA